MAKIYWAIHGYPPQQNAGAEWMAKEINDYLETKDHKILVYSDTKSMSEHLQRFEPDIIITHLDLSEAATKLAAELNIPCINIIHHTFGIPHLEKNISANIRVVYNADWVARVAAYPHPGLVVHPPVNPDRFKGVTGDPLGYVTLVNCNRDKGALIFQDIARSMPHRKFLAVKGNHGPQVALKARNLLQIEPVDDIREVLKKTALLLVPSIYESYGRIALEALACGIPVIATATQGLKEALTDTDACFIRNRSFIDSWLQSINMVSQRDRRGSHDQEEILLRKQAVGMKWQQSLLELQKFNDLINSLT